MIGRHAVYVITDLLLTELSFGASTMSTDCGCSTCCCLVDPRDTEIPSLSWTYNQVRVSRICSLIMKSTHSLSPSRSIRLAPPGVIRGKRCCDILSGLSSCTFAFQVGWLFTYVFATMSSMPQGTTVISCLVTFACIDCGRPLFCSFVLCLRRCRRCLPRPRVAFAAPPRGVTS